LAFNIVFFAIFSDTGCNLRFRSVINSIRYLSKDDIVDDLE